MAVDIDACSLSEKVVLCCLVDLEAAGTTPAHTGEVIRTTKDHLDAVEADTLGKLSEAEVNRALNQLEAGGYVAMVDADDTSPVGKGRPAYALDVEAAAVLDALADDAAVGALVDRVAAGTTDG